jgi:hypothetical protein
MKNAYGKRRMKNSNKKTAGVCANILPPKKTPVSRPAGIFLISKYYLKNVQIYEKKT